MPHDWGTIVEPDLPTEQVIEIRDKLRAGTMEVPLPETARDHPKFEEWQRELQEQMLAAFEKEAMRRLS